MLEEMKVERKLAHFHTTKPMQTEPPKGFVAEKFS
jgi:hypothetical protein